MKSYLYPDFSFTSVLNDDYRDQMMSTIKKNKKKQEVDGYIFIIILCSLKTKTIQEGWGAMKYFRVWWSMPVIMSKKAQFLISNVIFKTNC